MLNAAKRITPVAIKEIAEETLFDRCGVGGGMHERDQRRIYSIIWHSITQLEVMDVFRNIYLLIQYSHDEQKDIGYPIRCKIS